MNFRDYEGQLCIITEQKYFKHIDPENKSDATGILAYGYVDHEAGLTFEALALVKHNDSDIKIVYNDPSAVTLLRAGSLDEHSLEVIYNDELTRLFADRIDANKCIYYGNESAVYCRTFAELDPDRHTEYPDDIQVIFPAADFKTSEKIWVRVEKYLKTQDKEILFFSGTLLNEPYTDLGCHIRDTVTIASLPDDEGGRFSVWMRQYDMERKERESAI